MASPVSYTRAAQVAVLAVAADLYWNQGRTVSGIALGYLGNIAIEAYRQLSPYLSFKFSAYRRLSKRDIDEPIRQQEALQKALARVQKDYSVLFEEYIKYEKLSSPKEVLDFFIKALTGFCAGTADTLFDKIILKESRSLQESAALLDSESIFYHQILQTLHAYSEVNLKTSHSYASAAMHKESMEYFKKTPPMRTLPSKEWLASHTGSTEWGSEKDKRTAQYKEKFAKDLKDLGRNAHYTTFQDSEKFPVTALLKVYEENLEKATLAFPESQDFVGVVHTPNHVFAFQYGPKGYFIYDSLDSCKGLFVYPNREIFFQELQRQILYDAKEHAKKELPILLSALSEEQVKKYKMHFSIRPLQNINPTFSKG